eukprot:60508-Amphidinium_carterae.1
MRQVEHLTLGFDYISNRASNLQPTRPEPDLRGMLFFPLVCRHVPCRRSKRAAVPSQLKMSPPIPVEVTKQETQAKPRLVPGIVMICAASHSPLRRIVFFREAAEADPDSLEGYTDGVRPAEVFREFSQAFGHPLSECPGSLRLCFKFAPLGTPCLRRSQANRGQPQRLPASKEHPRTCWVARNFNSHPRKVLERTISPN